MTWTPKDARTRTRTAVAQLGFPQPPEWYPLIEERSLRAAADIEDRALVLNVVINCSYGMPTELARGWLANSGLLQSLTSGESAYLAAIDSGSAPDGQGHRLQVEGLWVLAWVLSLAPALDWGSYSSDDLASWLPNLRTNEGPDRLRKATVLRAAADVHREVDLAFCLTWACAEANLHRQPEPGSVQQYVVWERRRALEWLLGDDWDNPTLDT